MGGPCVIGAEAGREVAAVHARLADAEAKLMHSQQCLAVQQQEQSQVDCLIRPA